MEARFKEPFAEEFNGKLAETVQFIPVQSATDGFPESEIEFTRVVVLNQEDGRQDDIEIVFRLPTDTSRVAGISLNISNCPKCEVFVGECLEYQTFRKGLRQEDLDEMMVYKYEITFPSHQYWVISLKFKPTDGPVIIFGIDVLVGPGQPTTAAGIDLGKVEEMLAHSNLSEAAERCKNFLKHSLNRPGQPNVPPLPPAADRSLQGVLQLFDKKLTDMESRLMSHIDSRFETLKQNQDKHFRTILDKLGEGASSQ